jgi:hypothetical protein
MRIVVVGGFAESRKMLEPVAEAACEIGLGQDADVFRLRDVWDDKDKLNKAVLGQFVITHSAGIIPITPDLRPRGLVTYNGPMPLRINQLAIRALHKSTIHSLNSIIGPNEAAHWRTLRGNTAELVLHPLVNLKQLGKISRFNTSDRTRDFKQNGIGFLKRVISTHDEIYKRRVRAMNYLSPCEGYLQAIDGRHDDLIIRPAEVINETLVAPFTS